jgi:pyruvate/2-oxoglutarate/acetoin dehydrogenase E1 component
MAVIRQRQAVIAALEDELASNEKVFLMGEDISSGGAFKATEGLIDIFGPNRVLDTPISEMAFLGAGVGAAAKGYRPVVEMMFIEFIGVALDQLTTQGAFFRYLSRGAYKVPMTIRAAAGAGLGFGCQHSQLLDQWFRGNKGISLVMPSNPQSMYGLLRSAIQSDDPVVVLEHKALYGERGEVVRGDAGLVPLGKAAKITSGSDMTIVSIGRSLITAKSALESQSEWSADLIDLQTLIPWDKKSVLESVAKTKKLVIVEEGNWSGGWGHEVANIVNSELWGEMEAPVLRITSPDAPIPYAANLEERYLPSVDYIQSQITEWLVTKRIPKPWWEVAK